MRNNMVPIQTDAKALVAEIDAHGFAVIRDFVSPGELSRMREFVAAAVAHADGGYVGFTGPDSVAGSGLDTLAGSPELRALIEQMYETATGRPPPPQDYYQVLRCLTGRAAAYHSNLFHYDSYVLTMLLPIVIPTTGRPGDLVMIPNRRPVRATYAANVIDKILLDNKATQYILRWLQKQRRLKLTRLHLEPGSAYFFWGYRSIHTNEPCDLESVRATALIHYGNPHVASALYAKTRMSAVTQVAA